MILVDDIDKPLLEKYKWHINSTGYVSYKLKGKMISLHRVITDCPTGMVVDHINGNPLDNRRSNLRICTVRQNSCNSKVKVNNKSGYKGVILLNDSKKRLKKYKAQIRFNGKRLSLGVSMTPEEANVAYKEAAIKLHGEYARY